MFSNEEVLYHWEDQVRPSHAALLLVDWQNDFVHPEGWVASEQVEGFLGDTGVTAAAGRAGGLLSAARAAGLVTVFIRMIGDDKYLSPALHAQYRRNHRTVRPVCVQEGSWGADFFGDLRPDQRHGEFVIDKHRYSAFIGTRLDQVLRSNGVRTLVVCGVATSGCVESTIRDGFMLDYYVVTAADACADYEPQRHAATLTKMDISFGTVVQCDDIVATWSRASAEPATP